MMYLNQSVVRSYQTYKNLMEKVQAQLLIQSEIITLMFENITPQLVAVISNCQKN